MKTFTCAILAALALLSVKKANAVIFTNLYSFSASAVANQAQAGSDGGYWPQAALMLSGTTLFGTTADGSTNNDGTIFAYSALYGQFEGFIHTFVGSDGANPESDLIQAGKNLYGTTSKGGACDAGTVFAINTNGTGFTSLFSFAYTNGGNPLAGLVLSGSTLYGTASKGGAYGAGTIFAINTNGTGFTTIYNFNYTNGANPEADLLLVGGTLYGTTVSGGGSNGLGTVFAVNTNGSGFTNLFVFNGTNGDDPQAGLALVSNVLCGTTVNGGAYNSGTAFLIGTNGSGFTVLHSFGGSSGDGMWPYSHLLVTSNGASSYSLYGTTEIGGPSFGGGAIFVLNVSGPNLTLSSYNVLYSVSMPGINLGSPLAGLVLANGQLYGTATGLSTGGLFWCYTNGSGAEEAHSFGNLNFLANTNSDGANSEASLVLSGNTLYGTAYSGGTNGYGTLFTINTDGSGFATLCDLNNTDGNPPVGLTVSGNTLYGTDTPQEGAGVGTIFSLNLNGTGFTNLCSYSSDLRPDGNLIVSGNTLYGTTKEGGSSFTDLGAVFAVNTDGTDFTNLYSFNYGPGFGIEPAGGLVLNGNALYGTTEYGDGNYGTVYAINTDGTGFTNIFYFGGTNGSEPVGNMVLSGNTLYGVTESDANRNCGTIFAVNTDGSGFTNLYNFSGYDGANPQGNLVLCGGTLYGTTTSGGSGGYGTVFALNTNGTCFTTLYNFSGAGDGATPYDGLVLSGNTLYGTTSSGGSNGNGTVFALSLGAIPLNVQPDGGNVILTWGNPVFSLQAAPAVNGPYVTIPDAASPYTNTISASQQFFRLQTE